ncbi:MAG: DUF3221 domain-containing protein [Clostridia bacterium]|nr:DUF3221 domain-containing protein [Clostridia bacterium]
MKRLLIFFTIILLLSALVSCAPAKEASASGEFFLTGTVQSTENGLMVEAEDEAHFGLYQINTSGGTKYFLENGKEITSSALNVGVKVKISYNGQVARSIPPQIFANSITILSSN